jgi:Skp family chaperone for outer membrane proteins
MSRTPLIAAIALCAPLTAAILWAARSPERPAVIACVDLDKTFSQLEQLKDADARRERIKSEMDRKVEALKEELQGLSEELESFKPGSSTYLEAERKAISRSGDLNALQAFSELRREREVAEATREAYLAIRRTCGVLANEMKIDVVLIDDSIPPIFAADLQTTRNQINGRRVLYTNPQLDISDLVVERLNAEFRKAQGASGTAPAAGDPGSAPPPGAGAKTP